MDRAVRERFTRIRDLATFVEREAENGRWDSALARAATLNNHAAFVLDWLRGQAEYPPDARPQAGADAWEPPAGQSLENVSEPMAGTLDPDFAVHR